MQSVSAFIDTYFKHIVKAPEMFGGLPEIHSAWWTLMQIEAHLLDADKNLVREAICAAAARRTNANLPLYVRAQNEAELVAWLVEAREEFWRVRAPA